MPGGPRPSAVPHTLSDEKQLTGPELASDCHPAELGAGELSVVFPTVIPFCAPLDPVASWTCSFFLIIGDSYVRPLFRVATTRSSLWLHADRAAGGDRHHRR